MRREKKQARYIAYLLRLWETSDGDAQIWRASLEIPATGERRGFASLEELFAYLQDEAGANVNGKRRP